MKGVHFTVIKRYISALLCFALMFALCSCSIVGNGNSAVATVNGEEISASVYRYFLSNLKSQIGDAETVDGRPASEYASEKALEAAVQLYVTAQKAQELGVEFTQDMQKQLDTQISDLKTQAGSQEKYLESLEQYGLDEQTYTLLLKYTLIQGVVTEKVQSEYTIEQINDFYNNDMVNVQQILLKTTDDNNQPLSDSEIADKKALAEELLERINNGENFSDLKAQYNEDLANTELGYMVSEYSNFVEPFIKASMKLEVGQVSDIVESSYGYHIIKRYNHVDNSEMFTSAQTDILSCMFQRDVQLWTQAATVEYNDDVISSVEY